MTKYEFQQFFEYEILPKLREVRAAGQKEYAHDDSNAFRNFENLAAELGISREMVVWIYTRKHLDGILAHISGHRSQREPVQGRLKDAIMYFCLLWGMADEDEKAALDAEERETSPTMGSHEAT